MEAEEEAKEEAKEAAEEAEEASENIVPTEVMEAGEDLRGVLEQAVAAREALEASMEAQDEAEEVAEAENIEPTVEPEADVGLEADIEPEEDYEITLQSIRDGIIGKSTRGGYIGEIMHFLEWVVEHRANEWLSGFGSIVVVNLYDVRDGEGIRK